MNIVKARKTERFQLTLDLTREPELRGRVQRAMAKGKWFRLAQFARVCVEDFVERYESDHPELRVHAPDGSVSGQSPREAPPGKQSGRTAAK